MAGVLAPATHGTGIERLADLPLTKSGDHALRAMKLQAGGLPVQAEKIDQPLALSLKVGNQGFVGNLVETKRQRLSPVVAKPLHSERAATAVGEIVSERMESLNEQLKVARQADIPSVAPAKYDTGLREQLGGEAKMQHVARRLSVTRLAPPLRRCRYSTCIWASLPASIGSTCCVVPRRWRSLASVAAIRPISSNSPAPNTWEWLDAICSTSVVPDRGMPTMKTGSSLRAPPRASANRLGV